MRMLVTRPEPEAAETAARLAALDIEATVMPLLAYRTLPTSLPDATGFAAVALTSANALRALAERGAVDAFCRLKAYAVGDRTAEVAREYGFAEVESAGGSLSDLAELLAHAGVAGPIFYPAAQDQSGDLAKSLAPYGVMVVTARIYAMEEIEELPAAIIGEVEAGGIGAVLLYSRRTAAAFVERVAPHLSRATRMRLGMLCLSEGVAEPLMAAHFARIGLADYPSEDGMMGLALSFARDQNTP
jgi:uroporphyrinogen-III synthase